jgi:hypothetical protein
VRRGKRRKKEGCARRKGDRKGDGKGEGKRRKKKENADNNNNRANAVISESMVIVIAVATWL